MQGLGLGLGLGLGFRDSIVVRVEVKLTHFSHQRLSSSCIVKYGNWYPPGSLAGNAPVVVVFKVILEEG